MELAEKQSLLQMGGSSLPMGIISHLLPKSDASYLYLS
jgi:hypothetical protein